MAINHIITCDCAFFLVIALKQLLFFVINAIILKCNVYEFEIIYGSLL